MVLAGIFTIGTSACGDEYDGSKTPNAYLTYPVSGDDVGFDAGSLEGELRMQDRCLTITNDQGKSALAFAEGDVTWTAEDQMLEVGGTSFRIGDVVAATGGGGSELSNPNCPSLPVWRVAPQGLKVSPS